ncbi:hypothetical protein MNEG_6947 [Monoraphidium neglectum]|jgi:FkbM family methyltransferase|uniref:Methyltransferase FkbM domain-containing protein n=1 Tax=Monoraphidium neglectum TaxID=145388 RepID=A0A0D2L0V0_9CHLO|nr:hypothetical protein MNEG_6947 [Monoraphidium neglectum]KIZ01014.1 hypothetical protein MNEG_6947 [Monoraphidium neglectum]|eukprot:XP_013900033.1 hypothetical protein MNEG_6947 [Monoraphidium neglectum]
MLPTERNLSDSLLYMQQQNRVFLDPASREIMKWITRDPGERAVHDMFTRLFPQGCGGGADSQQLGLFLDVGSNAGFYSMVAASYGCQVLSFDPQKACADLVRRNYCLNGAYPVVARDLVAVINAPVSDVPTTLNLSVPARCEGVFFLPTGPGATAKQTVPTTETYQRTSVSLDGLLLNETSLEVYMIKIDTEGYEMAVLKSLKGMLAARRVRHIMIEVTPLFWARDNVPRTDIYSTFLPLLGYGCKIQRVLDMVANSTALLDSEDKLREYLVQRDFVQEDLLVSCPRA